jgi:hypothetical protein
MDFKPKYLILLVLLSVTTVQAQVNYYKIQNGVKTALKQNESVIINLNGERIPDINILVEIDLKSFKSTYKYDNIYVSFSEIEKTGYMPTGYSSFSFDSPMNQKKYGDAKYLQFYLFGTPEVKNDNNAIYLRTPYIDYNEANDKFAIRIRGRYKIKTEEYYENSTWKTRDIFSDLESIPNFVFSPITFILSEEGMINERYQKLISDGFSTIEDIKGTRTISYDLAKEYQYVKGFETNIPLVGPSPNYPNVFEAMKTIYEAKSNEITNEPDHKKALDLLYQWNKDYVYLIVSTKDKSILKTLNKELKGKTEVQSKLDIFKNFNP